MNKFCKIVSAVLSAAVCAGSVSISAFASDIEEVSAVNADNAVSVAAIKDFSVEQYPYSYVKTFDDESQIIDKILYNEGGKYKGPLSTKTGNPGLKFGQGYKGNALVTTFYSGHMNAYGGDKNEYYGNVADTTFSIIGEQAYFDPISGSSINFNLAEATVGTTKVGFWTKAEKTDAYDRNAPEYITYSITFTGSGASAISVRVPSDGEWHYVVADLSAPFSTGFKGIKISSDYKGSFGSEGEGRPSLKLNGEAGVYPVDKEGEYILDIEEAYVLNNDEYIKAKMTKRNLKEDEFGRYIQTNSAPKTKYDTYVLTTDADGNETYELDDAHTYIKSDYNTYILTKNEKGEDVYVIDPDGKYIKDVVTNTYVEVEDTTLRYSIVDVESYRIDASGSFMTDENGDNIPIDICGSLVKELWSTQIYIDEMLFYRTTESGGRTTFFPSGDDAADYYANNDIQAVLIDGTSVYDADTDGDDYVITLPKDFDLSDPASADRITVVTKCPDVIYSAQKDGSAFVPVDISEKGAMKSGSTGIVILPSDDSGDVLVSVISSQGTAKEYRFKIKWGFDLSVTAKTGDFDKVSGGRKRFTIKNYSDEDKQVQILTVVRNKYTNELINLSVSANTPTVIPAGATVNVNSTVSGVNDSNKDQLAIYFYFYDSVTSMNQVMQTESIIAK